MQVNESKEIWKDIKDYEGMYQVSNLGRIKTLERIVKYDTPPYSHTVHMKIKKISKKNNGYMIVGLWKDNKGKNFHIHRLVANAFIDNPENKATVNHIDSDKTNNCVTNLEWNTQSENNKHAFKVGARKPLVGDKCTFTKTTEKEVLEMRELYATGNYSYKELATLYNLSYDGIWCIINRKRWKHI